MSMREPAAERVIVVQVQDQIESNSEGSTHRLLRARSPVRNCSGHAGDKHTRDGDIFILISTGKESGTKKYARDGEERMNGKLDISALLLVAFHLLP